jgi:prevent-host-death family protein
MRRWQFQEAKTRWSQVVQEAQLDGPQVINRHGREEAVVLSMADDVALARPKESLVDLFRSSPLAEEDLSLVPTDEPAEVMDLSFETPRTRP